MHGNYLAILVLAAVALALFVLWIATAVYGVVTPHDPIDFEEEVNDAE